MRELGHHPDTGEDITVRRGPYGVYVQQGAPDPDDKKARPRRTSLPKGMEGDTITLEQALGLLSLPREIGAHPVTGELMEAGIGRFGPYVKMGAIFASLDKDDDVLSIGLNRAVDAIAEEAGERALHGPAPGDGRADAGQEGPVRALRAERQPGREPAARRDDGRRSRWTKRWRCWPRRASR